MDDNNNNNKCGLYTTYQILNQGCSQKYNYNENIHVDNNKIRTLEIMREKKGITVNNEDGKYEFSVSF